MSVASIILLASSVMSSPIMVNTFNNKTVTILPSGTQTNITTLSGNSTTTNNTTIAMNLIGNFTTELSKNATTITETTTGSQSNLVKVNGVWTSGNSGKGNFDSSATEQLTKITTNANNPVFTDFNSQNSATKNTPMNFKDPISQTFTSGSALSSFADSFSKNSGQPNNVNNPTTMQTFTSGFATDQSKNFNNFNANPANNNQFGQFSQSSQQTNNNQMNNNPINSATDQSNFFNNFNGFQSSPTTNNQINASPNTQNTATGQQSMNNGNGQATQPIPPTSQSTNSNSNTANTATKNPFFDFSGFSSPQNLATTQQPNKIQVNNNSPFNQPSQMNSATSQSNNFGNQAPNNQFFNDVSSQTSAPNQPFNNNINQMNGNGPTSQSFTSIQKSTSSGDQFNPQSFTQAFGSTFQRTQNADINSAKGNTNSWDTSNSGNQGFTQQQSIQSARNSPWEWR